jgi:hypothetical protein
MFPSRRAKNKYTTKFERERKNHFNLLFGYKIFQIFGCQKPGCESGNGFIKQSYPDRDSKNKYGTE